MPQALAALQEHRVRRRRWKAAQAEEIEAALDLARVEVSIRERRQRRLAPAGAAGARAGNRDRRAARLLAEAAARSLKTSKAEGRWLVSQSRFRSRSSHDIHRRITKRSFVTTAPSEQGEETSSLLKYVLKASKRKSKDARR
jgi:hypothetical protein